jgi:hypothetical protein
MDCAKLWEKIFFKKGSHIQKGGSTRKEGDGQLSSSILSCEIIM